MWINVEPVIPQEISAVSGVVSTGVTTVQTTLEGLRLLLTTTAAEAAGTEVDLVNRVNSAVDGVINAVNSALTNLLDSAGMYFLLVPIPKKGLARFAADAVDQGWTSGAQDTSREGSNLVNFPSRSVLDSADAATRSRLARSRAFQQIFSPSDLFGGGNAHFIRTVAEAIHDGNDVNRPRFEAGSVWAYGVFIAGASDVASILQSASFLERLFNSDASAHDVGATRGVGSIVPRGVNVVQGPRGAPIVSWELVPASKLLASFDNARVVATQYAIIRSDNIRARAATKVLDLFSKRELTPGMKGSYGAEVLAVRPYDGVVTRFVDDSPLEDGKTYYYHVAFATRVNPAIPADDADPTTSNVTRVQNAATYNLGFDSLSGAYEYQKPTRRRDYGAAAMGTAPDWRRTTSAANLIPGVDRYLGLVQEYLRSLASATSNVRAQNQSLVEMLTRQIDRLASFSAEFERRLAGISSVFEAPVAGTYATFRTGSGGVGAFLSDLVEAFEDPSDENRPPFENGDEFTTGAIVLAVGPDAGPVQAAFALLQSIFMNQESNPALDGIASIDGELAEIEATLVAEITETSTVFNPDMTPRAPGSGDASCD